MVGLGKVGDLVVLVSCSSQHLGGCSVHGSSVLCGWQWPVSCDVPLGEGRAILHLGGRGADSSASKKNMQVSWTLRCPASCQTQGEAPGHAGGTAHLQIVY